LFPYPTLFRSGWHGGARWRRLRQVLLRSRPRCTSGTCAARSPSPSPARFFVLKPARPRCRGVQRVGGCETGRDLAPWRSHEMSNHCRRGGAARRCRAQSRDGRGSSVELRARADGAVAALHSQGMVALARVVDDVVEEVGFHSAVLCVIAAQPRVPRAAIRAGNATGGTPQLPSRGCRCPSERDVVVVIVGVVRSFPACCRAACRRLTYARSIGARSVALLAEKRHVAHVERDVGFALVLARADLADHADAVAFADVVHDLLATIAPQGAVEPERRFVVAEADI